MRALTIFTAAAALSVSASAAPVLSDIASAQMAFHPTNSSIASTGPGTYDVVIEVEGENGGTLTSSAFTRWWGCEISPVAPGDVFDVTVTNFGTNDLFVPVWATSTDGVSFTDPERIPSGSVTDNVSASPQSAFDFTVTAPAGATAIRLWKFYPYTLQDRDDLIASLTVDPEGPVRSITTIGNSVEGRPIPMIELTNGNTATDAGKRRVWIHAGIHSAETTSYFVVEGFIDHLLNSGTPEAFTLLENAIVTIVPTLNPDGIARGNYRASAPNPPSDPSGADMESQYNDGGLGVTDFPECQAVLDQLTLFNGTPGVTPPSANPVEVLLNLHATHGGGRPFHFRHVATYPPSGVIPAVNALETQWIQAFDDASDFVEIGNTANSTLGASRPFVEAYCHDYYSIDPSYTGPLIMAITYEGVYGNGPNGVDLVTDDDYRQNGADMADALVDYFGFTVVPVGISTFGTD